MKTREKETKTEKVLHNFITKNNIFHFLSFWTFRYTFFKTIALTSYFWQSQHKGIEENEKKKNNFKNVFPQNKSFFFHDKQRINFYFLRLLLKNKKITMFWFFFLLSSLIYFLFSFLLFNCFYERMCVCECEM